jgi:hypothetical protein
MRSNVPSNRHASRPPLIDAYAETARASFVTLVVGDVSELGAVGELLAKELYED